jgi:hypothetical protein
MVTANHSGFNCFRLARDLVRDLARGNGSFRMDITLKPIRNHPAVGWFLRENAVGSDFGAIILGQYL